MSKKLKPWAFAMTYKECEPIFLKLNEAMEEAQRRNLDPNQFYVILQHWTVAFKEAAGIVIATVDKIEINETKISKEKAVKEYVEGFKKKFGEKL